MNPDTEPDFYRMPFVTPSIIPYSGVANTQTAAALHPSQEASDTKQSWDPSISKLSTTPANVGAQMPWSASGRQHGLPTEISIQTASNLDQNIATSCIENNRLALTDLLPMIDRTTYSTAAQNQQWLPATRIPTMEPTPLPPVYIKQGEEIHQVDSLVNVANHPGFVQLDHNTFVFADGRSDQGSAPR
jgi:hypothetical protein